MTQARPGRLSVGIIGAGRVGAVLGSALRAVGHEIVGASGASPGTLERIDVLLPGVPVLDIEQVARASDLLLVTVPDDELGPVIAWLARAGALRAGQLVVHTSGRYGIEVLRPALEAGAIGLAIHPAMTFTGTSLDLSRIEGAPFAVTAPAPVLPIGQALVVEIGGEPVVLPEGARPAYHAALAHASNHLVTLLVQSERLLEAAGVDDAARLLAPLTRASLEGALASSSAALTGPISRGDLGTVARHLDVLDDDAELTASSYRAMASATAALAHHSGRITAEQAAAVGQLLRSHPGPEQETSPGPGPGSDPAAPPRRPIAVAHTVADLRSARARMAGEVAVVMTMGALHPGHLALVRAARGAARHVVVTVFVNPTQFGDPRDLEAYPRTLEADLAALATLGADAPDLVFAPSVSQMYPRGAGAPSVTVSAGPLAERFEGASRPGHFDAVATVVAKLLHLTTPDVAVFGSKDAQQLAVVRAVVRDLDLPTWILAVPVVRDADGLALSSRNARLSAAGRSRALALSRAVASAERLAAAGAGPRHVVEAARAELDGVAGLAVEYADLVDPATFETVAPDAVGAAVVIVAAVVEGTRLIDAAEVTLTPASGAAPARPRP